MTRSEILAELPYFMEWGGASWNRLMLHALENFLEHDLTGKTVLELGPRYGRISCMLALLGAEVTGVDLRPDGMEDAAKEAEKWGVSDKVTFQTYDGNLDSLPAGAYDLVIAKSVLVLMPDLNEALAKINGRLRSGGKILFLENGYGNGFIHLLRNFRHLNWKFSEANYFTGKEVQQVKKHFNVSVHQQTMLPPIHLLCGTKKEG